MEGISDGSVVGRLLGSSEGADEVRTVRRRFGRMNTERSKSYNVATYYRLSKFSLTSEGNFTEVYRQPLLQSYG